MKTKRLLSLSCMALTTTATITAQSPPVATDGTEWTMRMQEVYPKAPVTSLTMRIDGDTIINGETHKPVGGINSVRT